MIPFKFGKLRDFLCRAFCVALATLISLNLTLPAFAASGQLQTVGWAETVSSFLMSCGIYPYDTDENGNFTEWSAQSLTALWDEFQKDVTGVAYDIVDITASLAKGVIAIASGRWSVLREFATWIVSKYNLTDNQTGVELGRTLSASNVPYSASAPAESWAWSNGLYVGYYSPDYYRIVSSSTSALAYRTSANTVEVVAPWVSETLYLYQAVSSSFYYTSTFSSYGTYMLLGLRFPGGANSDLPLMTRADALSLLASGGGFEGILADTSSLSIPAALPEGTQFGGLTVQGAGEGVTLEQLQELIRDAVQDALKPAVNVVPVVVAPDVDVNANGEISADLDINSSTVPMTASDYSAPNITGVFPFSIPWDVIAVFSALNAEPVRPDFQVSIYVPVLDIHVPFHIGVNAQDAQAVDSAFAVWRNMLLVLMCVGTLLLFAKLLL